MTHTKKKRKETTQHAQENDVQNCVHYVYYGRYNYMYKYGKLFGVLVYAEHKIAAY